MRSLLAGCLLSLLSGLSTAAAQPTLAATTYRVFLRDGRVLPSYGDAARVGDRLIFNLLIVTEHAGRQTGESPFTLQLMSLPVALVDLDRTGRYSETMGANHYAATRGQMDFESLTAEVTRNLGLLTSIEDRRRQLAIAEELRQRVQAWPRDHFHYRAKEVQELVGLFSDVINELRVATGAGVSLDLSTGPIEPARESLMAAPAHPESVQLALAAAEAADLGDERLAILRTTLAAVGDANGSLRQAVVRRLDLEQRAGAAYAALAAEFRRRADTAVKAGNVRAMDDLRSELLKRDQQLGFRRPGDVGLLLDELEARREAASARRAALDRYAALQGAFLRYERRVRPAFAGLDGLSPVLEKIRDMAPAAAVTYEGLVSVRARLERLREMLDAVAPPGDLVAIHATLASALSMAREASTRRQQASVTTKSQVLQEASSAAAGAIMLLDRARADLVEALFPPR